MSKGTILYIGGFELPDKNAAAHRVLSNGKILRELGYNVVFISIDKNLSYDSSVLTTKKVIQGFDTWFVPYPNRARQWISYLIKINYFLEIAANYSNIRAVICYNYQSIALLRIRNYCREKNIRIIADCTEWYSTKGKSLIYKFFKGLDTFLRMRIIHKQLDGLIVISRYLENYYRHCCNVVRIPPLVDINEKKWNISKQELKDRFDNRLHFVYSGSPGKNKDKIVNIIDALYKLKEFENYQMNIVGVSKNQFIDDYPNYQEKIDILGKRVSFVGKISHEESLKELKNADYSIFIRDKTRLTMAGFPTKFVESITCSTPVITNDSSDIKEYFFDESNGILVKDSTVNELVKSLKNILEKENQVKSNYNKIDNEIFHYAKYKEIVETLLNQLVKIQ